MQIRPSAALTLWLLLAAPAQAGELEQAFFENGADKLEAKADVVLRHAPADADALAVRAVARMKRGAFSEARADLAKLPAGGSTVADLARGDYAWYTGDWAAAHDRFADARRRSGRQPHAAWGEASSVLHMGRLDEAERQAELLIAQGKDEGPAFQAMALVVKGAALAFQAQEGNWWQKATLGPRAHGIFEEAVKRDPANANALSSLGRFCLDAPPLLGGDTGRAIQLLDRSNTIEPYFYLNHAALIRAYVKAGDLAKAKVEASYYRAKFGGMPVAEQALAKIPLQ